MRILLLLLLLVGAAFAHPLGPPEADSVTTFRLTPSGISTVYKITFKEAAALTILPQLDQNHDGELSAVEAGDYLKVNQQHFQEKLSLKLDGQSLPLRGDGTDYKTEKAPSGLQTLQLEIRFTSPCRVTDSGTHTLSIEDKGFEGVTGWREMRFEAFDGLGILKAPQPPRNAVEALQTRALVEFHRGESTWKAGGGAQPALKENRLLDMIKGKDTPQLLLLTLGVAYVLGALHALQPGHGKTVVGAYLIGSRGTLWHAVLLGLVVTFTHTASVFLLGVVCLLSFRTVPDAVIPWIGCASGLLISVMGVVLLTDKWKFGHTHSHDHGHSHSHGLWHSHSHSHGPAEKRESGYAGTVPAQEVIPVEDQRRKRLGLLGLISLGISGGMVPCPDAIIVLLGAVHLNKVALGLIVLLAFSAGLASVLVLIGMLMVTASHFFQKTYPSSVTIRRVSELSYLFIIFVGIGMAVHSLYAGGIFGR